MLRKINPMRVLDFNNWPKSFIKFIKKVELEDSMQQSKTVFVFSKKTKTDFKFDLSIQSKVQIFTLLELRKKTDLYELVTNSIKDKSLVDTRVENILGSLKDKLTQFKTTKSHISGYEKLNEIKILNNPAFSVESYGAHRIVYFPLFQYDRIKIDSVLFHYNDEPRDPIDLIIFDAVDIISMSQIRIKDLNTVVKVFLNKFN